PAGPTKSSRHGTLQVTRSGRAPRNSSQSGTHSESEPVQSQALTALLLVDGKPGHYHQAEGVIAAIRRMRLVTSHRLEVRRRFFVPTRLLLQLVNRGVAPANILRLGYGIDAARLPKAEVVVSAGGGTPA